MKKVSLYTDKEIVTKIVEKLDKLDTRLDSVDKTLILNTASLEEHVRRCNLLESQMVPVQRHVEQFNGVLKFIGVLSVGIGIVSSILKIFNLIKF